jgi:hypothetical protein
MPSTQLEQIAERTAQLQDRCDSFFARRAKSDAAKAAKKADKAARRARRDEEREELRQGGLSKDY